jgi:hypothetical protein
MSSPPEIRSDDDKPLASLNQMTMPAFHYTYVVTAYQIGQCPEAHISLLRLYDRQIFGGFNIGASN